MHGAINLRLHRWIAVSRSFQPIRMRSRFLFSPMICLLAICYGAQTHAQNAGGLDPARLETFVESILGSGVQAAEIPGAVFVVVQGGEVVFSKGYGFADLEEKIPMDPERTVVRVGSVSKVFTATTVMQLYEQEHLDLHEDVNEYLRRFQIPETFPKPITLAHSLTHTAGLDRQVIGNWARPGQRPTLGEHLAAHMPRRARPVGNVISYSNYGPALAGQIVELVSGMPFEEYAEAHILRPLEMHRSTFEQPPEDLMTDLATEYRRRGGQLTRSEYAALNTPPAGSLHSTAIDMAQFMIAHLQDGEYKARRILETSTAREMHKQQFTNHPHLSGICYGFWESYVSGHRLIHHGGTMPGGSRSYLCLVPEKNIGLFISQNGGVLPLRRLIRGFVDTFLSRADRPLDEPAPAEELPALEPLAGRYRLTRRPTTTVAKLTLLLREPDVEAYVRTDGDLGLRTRFDDRGRFQLASASRFVQVKPLYFVEVGDHHRVAIRTDSSGRGTHVFINDETPYSMTFERIFWYDRRAFHLGLLGFYVIVFLATCTTWTVGALVRRLRNKHAPAGHLDQAVPRRSSQARLLAGATCGLALSFIVGLVFFIWVSPPALVYGEMGAVPYLLILPLMTTVLTPGLVVFLILAWKDSYWSLPGRMHYTLVVLVAVAFIPFLLYWNLLGFNY